MKSSSIYYDSERYVAGKQAAWHRGILAVQTTCGRQASSRAQGLIGRANHLWQASKQQGTGAHWPCKPLVAGKQAAGHRGSLAVQTTCGRQASSRAQGLIGCTNHSLHAGKQDEMRGLLGGL